MIQKVSIMRGWGDGNGGFGGLTGEGGVEGGTDYAANAYRASDFLFYRFVLTRSHPTLTPKTLQEVRLDFLSSTSTCWFRVSCVWEESCVCHLLPYE